MICNGFFIYRAKIYFANKEIHGASTGDFHRGADISGLLRQALFPNLPNDFSWQPYK
jgi:hypothetical protein